MSRVAILPHFGDPFALHYWLRWCRRAWQHEIDALCIVSSNVGDAANRAAIKHVVDLFRQQFKTDDGQDKPIYLMTSYEPIQHGDAINKGLDMIEQDLVMLVEEDALIFKSGRVGDCFSRLEQGEFDAIGSGRASCSEIIAQTAEAMHPDAKNAAIGRDGGPNFWPCFFFARADDLREKTDRNFNAKSWEKGEVIKPLGVTAEETLAADTFGWASIQLRAAGLNFGYINQYHAHPDDIDDYNARRFVFDGQSSWFHIGSLSGWRSLFDKKKVKIQGVAMEEIARRMAWYLTFVDVWLGQEPNLLTKQEQAYRTGVTQILALYEIPQYQIAKRQMIYQKLMGGL